MLIYEITATVAPNLASDFEQFMTERHIPDVLATGKLAAAFFARAGNEYRIGYHCSSKSDLDEYLAKDAESLRAEFGSRFPEGISLTRNIFNIVALFPGQE